MSYKDLDIKLSYISCGESNIAESFLVPVLKHTKLYRRSVGFFSSGVFGAIIDGIVALSRNNGKIQLIASPRLQEEDIIAINLGYQKRDEIIKNAFSRDFFKEMEQFDDIRLQLLVALIANETLDIKIAVTESIGIYHDKFGILEDFDGNLIVFYGSANASLSGYKENYEKIRIVKSWDLLSKDSINDEYQEFENLWNGKNEFVKIYDYKESAKNDILKVIEKRKEQVKGTRNTSIKLRDYQEEAIEAWINNNYRGFYVMATGTGKTWTAIFSAKRLVEKIPAMIVICAPYKHLIKQWSYDVEKVFPEAKIIMVSSENTTWETQISEEIIRREYSLCSQIIIISTIASFKMKRFEDTIKKSKELKLLIIDEAHRFTERQENLKEMYPYMLGLSATPYSGASSKKGQELMEWFGGQVFNLPIEKALERGFLVPYNYYPIYVHATKKEEENFRKYTKSISSCFRNNICINPDLLFKSVRKRLRIISMAEEKQYKINEIIERIKEKDHVVVYCGDGRLFDKEIGKELRHIQSIKKVLTKHEFKVSQFTATESMAERMELVDLFNKGEISALAAIRCLDEGINIPSIKSALILSSNDDYREFVQRRGRILRTYDNKKYANIYDVIVLPSTDDMRGWAKIELRRFKEYGRLALNWNELKEKFEEHLLVYNLSNEDIDIYDYDTVEEELNE